MLEVFNNKTKEGVDFGFIEHDDVLVLEEGKLRSRKRELALPYTVTMTCLNEIDKIRIIDEGIYPTAERQFQKIDKGDKSSFRVAGPFRVFCKELEQLKILVNGEGIKRVKESEGNYRFELVK